jgi:esterase/lipase superfamily enzyme
LKKKYILINEPIEVLKEREFFDSLGVRLAKDNPDRAAFIFVHGYNNTFLDAARRTAQIAVDINIPVTPVFYSWPSQGRPSRYRVDNAMSDLTAGHLEQFLRVFAEQSQADRIYVIAHSMGNKATLVAMKSLFARRPDLREKFTQVVLAAPDISREVFLTQIVPAFSAAGPPVTIYASHRDRALRASRQYSYLERLGEAQPPYQEMAGVEFIDASDVDTNFMGHDYIASSSILLDDMAQLFKTGNRAGSRKQLRGFPSEPYAYWKFVAKTSVLK